MTNDMTAGAKQVYDEMVQYLTNKSTDVVNNLTTKTIRIKYTADIEHLEKIEKGDWIDLRAAEDYDFQPGEFKLVRLGVCMELPEGYEASIAPRSSTFKHWGLLQPNAPSCIDNSYCGDTDEWLWPAYATRACHINKNDRVCQFRIVKNQPPIEFEEVEMLDNPSRDGLGSTGKA